MTQKMAIVSGASKGVGLAITRRLIEEGWHVVGLSRTAAPIQIGQAYTQELIDLSNTKTLSSEIKSLYQKYPQVDALVCNAGKGAFGSIEELSFEQIRGLMDLNFMSQAFLAKTFIPTFKKRKKGDIIFMGSEASLQGKRMGSIYCASKFAVRGFAQALREECSSSGVRVSLINPGMILTDFFDSLSFSPGDEDNEHIKADDIADVVCMLLNLREGTVIDEVNMSPQSKKIKFKKN